MSSSSSATTTPPVKRACDSCHRRKVKCLPIGEEARPCRNCVAAGLECTFYNKVQKKGPKGSRAKVLSEIRETQKLISPRPAPSSSPSAAEYQEASRSQSPLQSLRSPGLMTPKLILTCVKYFFNNLYDAVPIHHPASLERLVSTVDQSTESYCQVTAFCAYVLIQSRGDPRPILDSHEPVPAYSLGSALLEECIRLRRSVDWQENPTISTVYTSFFIFRCQHALDKKDSAWIYLRQAMTMGHVLGLNKENTYHGGDPTDAAIRRKLFWTLFIAERVYALKLHRPLSLYATIRLPEADESAYRPEQLFVFIHLIKLYALLDDKFFSLWNHTTTEGVTPDWLEQLQRNFTNALPSYFDQSSPSVIELIISQQWLRTLVWRQSMLHGSSSMMSGNDMRTKFIIDVCNELLDQMNAFQHAAMEAQGLDLAEKLFDVTCCLVDCISALPYQLAFDPRQQLQRLLSVISSLSSAQARLLPLLNAKLSSQPELSGDPAFPTAGQPPHMSMMEQQNDPTALGLHMMEFQATSQHMSMGSMPGGGGGYMQDMMGGLQSTSFASRAGDLPNQPPTSGPSGFAQYRYLP